MTERPKCIGILGRLFGHKFGGFTSTQYMPFCLRCGMKHE